MNFIKERAKDVSLIAQCVVQANTYFRSFIPAGEPSLYVSCGEPLWLVPMTNPSSRGYWDRNYYMFYYPYNGNIFFRYRYQNRLPTDIYFDRVSPFEEGKTFNTYGKIYKMCSDQNGQYIETTYKQALLTEKDVRRNFQSEYYFDLKWALKSVKLIEVQDCILRWIITMETPEGGPITISADPLGYSYIPAQGDGKTDFEGKEAKENKDYFSINNTRDFLSCADFVSMRYHGGSIEILNFSEAQTMPPKQIFGNIQIYADY